MTSQGFSRKRPAPGADPVPYPSQAPAQMPAYSDNSNSMGPPLTDDAFFQWGESGQPASSGYNDNSYATNSQMNTNTYPQGSPQSSTQLTRRPMAQITSRGRVNEEGSIWPDNANRDGSSTDPGWGDDIGELEAKAQVAKRDAQAKRKQIPPFVQKLNSFLEDGRNTELIRWSDDGNSFVVLDEDEFAKTLIPELFKHNNYASFVRQLNMYGFHKKVGLSDNSMRASERKNKSPSEYSNPYFRRGHPDLLWLIQKPKNVTAAGSKRKGKGDPDQNDEDVDEYVDETVHNPDTRVRARPGQLTLDNAESALSTEQFQTVQRQLAAIRHQQNQITRMMQGLRREHEQLYGQAATFQEQHNRHENSINAILTFLATVYNRSLQGHDNLQGIANMFTNSIPVGDATGQGNVVDVGDLHFHDINMDGTNQGLAKPFRKQPLLLTNGTPPVQQEGRASTLSPRAGNSPYTSQGPNLRGRGQQSPLIPNVEEVFDPGVNSPNSSMPLQSSSSRGANVPQRDMMSMIQNANARNNSSSTGAGGSPSTPAQDFSNVLNSLESSGGSGPLSTSERADVLRMINNTTRQPSGTDNALINSTPPPGPANFHRRLASTQADLDQLAKLQAEQDKSVQNLTNLLQPLSPTGSIPGIGDGQSLPPPPLDIDDFLNHNEYFADFPSDGHGNYDFGNTGLPEANHNAAPFDYKDDDEMFGNVSQPAAGSGARKGDFGFDGIHDYANMKHDHPSDYEHDVGGRVESVPSSEAPTPKSSEDTKPGISLGKASVPATRSKGRKLSSASSDRVDRKRARG